MFIVKDDTTGRPRQGLNEEIQYGKPFSHLWATKVGAKEELIRNLCGDQDEFDVGTIFDTIIRTWEAPGEFGYYLEPMEPSTFGELVEQHYLPKPVTHRMTWKRYGMADMLVAEHLVDGEWSDICAEAIWASEDAAPYEVVEDHMRAEHPELASINVETRF